MLIKERNNDQLIKVWEIDERVRELTKERPTELFFDT